MTDEQEIEFNRLLDKEIDLCNQIVFLHSRLIEIDPFETKYMQGYLNAVRAIKSHFYRITHEKNIR